MSTSSSSKRVARLLWDTWCIGTVVGIWPRFIEPQLISTTRMTLPLAKLPKQSSGIRVAQISDLHLHRGVTDSFLSRLSAKTKAFNPDIVVLTGDFVCHSNLTDPVRLKALLEDIRPPGGCYAVFGNHDYSEYVCVGPNGDYDVGRACRNNNIGAGLKRLFRKPQLSRRVSEEASSVPTHESLSQLLRDAGVTILHNDTVQVAAGDAQINITGLGEHMAARCHPEAAFSGYDSSLPGLVLSHNPDSIPILEDHPGDLILCGHSHGGAVNLPFLWRRVTVLENMNLRRGLHRRGDKLAYISRGLGGSITFRWFCQPELVCLTLVSEDSET